MSVNEPQKNVPNALAAGYRFNEFEIREVIGDGGFGIVYRAWDHLLERSIAIKEYLPESLASRSEDLSVTLRADRYQRLFSAGMNSFIQEARLLARFNHPGLLHVLRFWEENGTAYMGTLYYSGMTLKEWQLSHPDSINEAWIRQLLPPLFGAINTLHRAGYLHRDISLDNIQLQDNQLPVLIDFGSARREIGNLCDETEIMLKPGYAPIEQYSEEGDSDQGPWTDIYALGALLHTLIVGNPPPVSVVRCIEDHYQPLSTLRPRGYSLPFLNAVDLALQMAPHQRPQSIEALAALIDLPLCAMDQRVTGVTPAHEEPAPLADPPPVVNPAVAPPRSLMTARVVKRLMRPLPLLGGLAIVAILALMWGLKQHNNVTAQPASATSLPGTDVSARAGQANVASTPAMATVYLKMSMNDVLLLNNSMMEVKPNNSGYVSLNLAAGIYQLELRSTSGVRSQQLTIDRAGTWLITPGK